MDRTWRASSGAWLSWRPSCSRPTDNREQTAHVTASPAARSATSGTTAPIGTPRALPVVGADTCLVSVDGISTRETAEGPAEWPGTAPTPGKATVTPKPDVAGMSETSVPLSTNMTFFVRISGTQCKCLLDTASSISVLNQNALKMIPNAPKLRKTAVRAKTATQEELPLFGRVSLCFHIGYSAPEGPFSVEDRRRCCNHLPQRHPRTNHTGAHYQLVTGNTVAAATLAAQSHRRRCLQSTDHRLTRRRRRSRTCTTN